VVELRRRGVTHLVVRAGTDLSSPELSKVHEDEAYQVYRVLSVRGTD